MPKQSEKRKKKKVETGFWIRTYNTCGKEKPGSCTHVYSATFFRRRSICLDKRFHVTTGILTLLSHTLGTHPEHLIGVGETCNFRTRGDSVLGRPNAWGIISLTTTPDLTGSATSRGFPRALKLQSFIGSRILVGSPREAASVADDGRTGMTVPLTPRHWSAEMGSLEWRASYHKKVVGPSRLSLPIFAFTFFRMDWCSSLIIMFNEHCVKTYDSSPISHCTATPGSGSSDNLFPPGHLEGFYPFVQWYLETEQNNSQ
ncbi:uncharacterized protein CLUP02_04007 [Colletotrichum lupini]|uniref:Uncharacterized protein n=1 Tax=Colletotrichum lupini TaxID=145971 RepID=A0A9Q8WDD3_9PEZI|nr:uncharacterized protein CLUP02_04007 [Colletotrichum lupini]UQC78530.1 hypothetical protein CLUP02_04007 [Colletotrichum lupini]